jgi:hypothetical protein
MALEVEFVDINNNKGIIHKVNSSDSLAILIPGFPGNRVDARRIMVKISRQLPISSLRIDIGGMGLSPGKFENITYEKMADEYIKIIKYARINLNYSKIKLIIFSESAKLLPYIIKEERVDKIILCNGVLCKESISGPKKSKLSRYNNEIVVYTGFGVFFNYNLLKFAYKDLLEFLLNNKDKILAIYGDKDTLTIESRKFLQKNGFNLKIIENSDHLFTNIEWENKLINLIKKGCLA